MPRPAKTQVTQAAVTLVTARIASESDELSKKIDVLKAREQELSFELGPIRTELMQLRARLEKLETAKKVLGT